MSTEPGSGDRPGARPDDLDGVADLLRDVLNREAEAVRPSADGLERILAAAGPRPAADGPRPAARGPETVELPVVGHPAKPPATGDGADGESPGKAGVLSLVAGRRRRGFGGWAPILSAAAAVVALAGGLGAVRIGAIEAPELVRSVAGARQPDQTARRVTTGTPAQALPVYLVSRQEGRWGLVREFAATTIDDPHERLQAALRLAVAGTASDPDLTSVWGGLDLTGDVSADLGDDEVVVRLSAGLVKAPPAKASTDAESATTEAKDRQVLARLAVSQLVWTATAVIGRESPVRVEGPAGTSAQLFGVLALGGTFSRGSGESDPRAPVWISTVADGQLLARGTAVIGGDATTTESGTVEWTLSAPDGATTATGSQRLTREDGTAPRIGERGVFQLRLSVPDPGTYRLTVVQRWLWPSPGAEVTGWVDTKTLRVG